MSAAKNVSDRPCCSCCSCTSVVAPSTYDPVVKVPIEAYVLYSPPPRCCLQVERADGRQDVFTSFVFARRQLAYERMAWRWRVVK
jgi:hypothetical protein